MSHLPSLHRTCSHPNVSLHCIQRPERPATVFDRCHSGTMPSISQKRLQQVPLRHLGFRSGRCHIDNSDIACLVEKQCSCNNSKEWDHCMYLAGLPKEGTILGVSYCISGAAAGTWYKVFPLPRSYTSPTRQSGIPFRLSI